MTSVEMEAAAALCLEVRKSHPPGHSSAIWRLVQILILPLHYSWALLLITLTHIDFFFLSKDQLPHPSLI